MNSSRSLHAAVDPLALRAEAARLWRLPALDEQVDVVVSGRLRTSLGLFDPRRRQVRLARFLGEAPEALVREVVWHELAHAAVRLVHGPGVRPHGREWRAHMRAAGWTPRARLPRALVADLLPPSARAAWLHRCTSCGAQRLAGRPMRGWGCGPCLDAGRGGRLEIERVEGAGA